VVVHSYFLGAALTVALLILVEKNSDASAATFSPVFGATHYHCFRAQTICILGINK
jgi:hypothetical protein